MILALVGLAFTPRPVADPEKGKEYYQTCLTCHGPNGEGNTPLNAPRLTDQADWYLIRQLENFQSGLRGSHAEDILGVQMQAMAATLPDAQAIKDVVEYIATLEAPPPPPTETGGDPENGETLFATCVACHGPAGEGMEALGGPRLSGQHDWYLTRQLQHFQSGIRGTDPDDLYGAQMRALAPTLPNAQAIKDVVAYIQTLE